MIRRDLLRAVLATPLTGWLRPWFGEIVRDPDNAATIYQKAFGWVESLQPEDRTRLLHPETCALDDPEVVALIRRAGPALKAIRQAAAIGRCQWERELLTCDDLGKDQFSVSNTAIIWAACMSARLHAARGQGRAALDDLFAALTLAHRVGTGGVYFSRILEGAGEVSTFKTLGRTLPGLDRAALDDLALRLDALPSPEPASAAIGPELRFIVGSIRAKLMKIGPVLGEQDWKDIGFDVKESAPLIRLTGGDRALLLAHLEAHSPAFAELGRRLDLPRPDCLTAFAEFAKAERAAHPLMPALLKNAWSIRHVVDRMRALRAMTRAGLALVRSGESAFRAVPDPFGTGPFGLEHRGRGYLIRSALKDEDRPEVSLAIGEPG